MKKGGIYTVFFTIVMCVACAGVLTYANRLWHDRIKANESFSRIRAIMGTLGLVAYDEQDRASVIDKYGKSVALKKEGELDVYEAKKEQKTTAFALEVTGRGKYGPIKGILSIEADRKKIKDMTIYEHEETPGLGGRITSREWLDQFKGVALVTDGVTGVIISSKSKGPNVIDAVTGASKTMRSMEKMVNTIIERFLSGGMMLMALDLKLGPDEVTRATPGRPKTTVEYPPNLNTNEVRRADFMVPPGTINLAAGKPAVASSGEEPIMGEISQLTDGGKTSEEWDMVELGPDDLWVQIDLEKVCTIYGIAVWHFYKNPAVYNDVIVQVADDAEFTQNVRTLFNNDHDNSSGQGKGEDMAFFTRWWAELVDARGDNMKGMKARFVRVWSKDGCQGEPVRFVEIGIYGK